MRTDRGRWSGNRSWKKPPPARCAGVDPDDLRAMPKPRLVFATRNPGKVLEIAQMLSDHYDIVGLDAIGCTEDIPETAPTIPGNAIQPSRSLGQDCSTNSWAASWSRRALE